MNFEIPKIVALVFVTVSIPLLFCQESVAQTYGRPQLIKDPRDLRQQAFQFYLEARYDEAAELYQEAIELAKESYGEKSSFVADLYYEAGSMCLEEGNFSMASRFLPLAVKINPNYTMARVKLSELLMMKGKSDEAFGQIGEALKRDPTAIEAQRQLVKLLMDREKKEKDISRGAGLACTWESFRLNNLTKMVVNQTLKHIAQWQTKLKTGQSQVPTVSVAMSSAPVLAKPEKPPEREKQTLPVKTTKAKTPVNTPPRTVKAKPKPVLAKKEKPKPKPIPTQVARTSSPPAPQGPVGKRSSRAGGLVPPPPPVVPSFMAPPPPSVHSDIILTTEASVRPDTKASEKKPVKKKKKPKPVPEVQDEPDFLLDWASEKKK